MPCYHTNHKTQLTAASLFQSSLMVIVRKPPANCARPARPWQGRSATIEFAEAAVGVQLHASPPVAITEVKLAWHLHSNFNSLNQGMNFVLNLAAVKDYSSD